MASPIPVVYRVVFTYIDPFFCAVGATMHLYLQETALNGYSPLANAKQPAIETVALMESMAGFFLMLGIIEGFLLRAKATDTTVWRTVQAGAFWVDVCMVWATYKQLTVEGRLYDWQHWSGDDWRNGVANAGMGLVRLACALGVGFGQRLERTSKGKRS